MGARAIAALAALLLADGKPPVESGTPYENERCGLCLVLPPGWMATAIKKEKDSEARCVLGLRPANWIRRRGPCSAAPYAIYVSVYSGTLEDAEKLDLLVKEDGQWVIEGRAGARNGAEPMKHPAGRGIRGESEVGCYGPDGYEGMAETEIAIVESGHRLVAFVADVNLTLDRKDPGTFRAIVRSLRIPSRRESQ
jgi:hypothetical protein